MTPTRTYTQHLRPSARHVAPSLRADARRAALHAAPTVSVVLVAERPDAGFASLLLALAENRDLAGVDLIAVLGAPPSERPGAPSIGDLARYVVLPGARRMELRALGMREAGDIVTLLDADVSIAEATALARRTLEAASHLSGGALEAGPQERGVVELPIAR